MSINKNAVEVLCGELRFNSRGEFESKVVEITPEIAKKLLSFSVGNRAIKTHNLTNIINHIKSGTFKITNNAISFDDNLTLKDGHHRLKAIVISGCSVNAVLSVNIPSENFRYVDRGAVRSNADVISLESKHAFDFEINGKITAIASFLNRVNGGSVSISMNPDNLEKILIANQNGISFVCEKLAKNQRSICSAGVRAAIASAFYCVNNEKLEEFCLLLSKGASVNIKGSSNAALVCRDYLMSSKLNEQLSRIGLKRSEGSFTIQRVIFYAVQYCIQAFVSGKDISKVVNGASLDKESNQISYKAHIYPPIIPFLR